MIQRFLVAMALSAVVALTFAPALRFQFLNWDDRLVIVENAALTRSDVAEWAATTTYMDHYQPASWLVWARSAAIFRSIVALMSTAWFSTGAAMM